MFMDRLPGAWQTSSLRRGMHSQRKELGVHSEKEGEMDACTGDGFYKQRCVMRKDKLFALEEMRRECEKLHMELHEEALREAIEALKEKENQEDDLK